MKYTLEERLDIGRRVYTGEISYRQAMELFDLSKWSIRNYVRSYRDRNHLPPKEKTKDIVVGHDPTGPTGLEAYETMSKEELIQELIKARIRETRLKKGYEVKGDGSVIHYSNKNTR